MHSIRITAFFLIVFAVATAGTDGFWNAPDRAQRLSELIPGRTIMRLQPTNLLADINQEAMAKWSGPLTDDAFAQLPQADPPDADFIDRFPRSISPYARIRGVDIDPMTYTAASLKGNARKSLRGLFTYCPFCDQDLFGLNFSADNPDLAVTTCCQKKLYYRNAPADYDLKHNATASFRYLDDSIREIPCTLYKDRHGNEWELFIQHLFDNRFWLGAANQLLRNLADFNRTGDPKYPYKSALILDYAADTYFALPLSFSNLLAPGRDGSELGREEWESLPRPVVYAHNYLGPWNRRNPFSAGDKGWINMHREAIWAEPFAVMRHHPAFKYYSRQKYGSPEALAEKITTRLLREICLLYKSSFSQRLLTNYQEANYKDLLICAILAEDKYLIEFAGANQELTLYNHHYHDGMNGEGAQNYMAMLNSYYYPYMSNPDGWQRLDPDFLKQNPFFIAAAREWNQLNTLRGIQLEFGDQHHHLHSRLQNDQRVTQNAALPSRNWPGFGVGLLRAGAPQQRLEVSLHYSRATLHNAQDMLGMSLWFDGVPAVRTGGYASWWRNIRQPEMDELGKLNFPKPLRLSSHSGRCWSWVLAHSALNQNTVTINDCGPGPGWSDNRGTSELITFIGAAENDETRPEMQILEARSQGEFPATRNDFSGEFRRALITLESSSGAPYLIDILIVEGGEKQTSFYSIWGERRSDTLPIKANFPDLAAAWYNDNPPASSANSFVNQQMSILRIPSSVREHEVPGKTWQCDWDIDYYAFWRNQAGEDIAPRQGDPNHGKIALRLLSLPQDDKTRVWSAVFPWTPLVLKQELGNGATLKSVSVSFADVFDMVAQRREVAGEQPLDSRFVNLFVANRPGQTPHIADFTSLDVLESTLPPHQVAALHVTTIDGETDTLVYQMKNAALRLDGGIETDARFLLIRQNPAGQITLVRMVSGSYALVAGRRFGPALDLTGQLDDIEADLTGYRHTSALYIRPDAPWPVDALAGKTISIRCLRPTGLDNAEAFAIAAAKALPDGRVRLELADAAPLIAGWHQVAELDPERPHVLRTNRPMSSFANQPWYEGAKVFFPERGKTYLIADTEKLGGGTGGTFLTLAPETRLAADGIIPGDWYIIYAIEPGQTVKINGELCLRNP